MPRKVDGGQDSAVYHNIIVVLMQQLKNQNGLLLQLVTGLQNQINSKNRQNQILFQQYDQLAQDNAALRTQIDTLRLKVKHFEQQVKPERKSESSIPSPRQLATQDLKLKLDNAQQQIKTLRVELEQKGGMIILLQSQLTEIKNQPPPPPAVPEPADNSQRADLETKIAELQQSLIMKQNTVNELTEYMNDQANKISELTRQSIATINNYEEKIEEKDKYIQELNTIIEKHESSRINQKEQRQHNQQGNQEEKQTNVEVEATSAEEVVLLKAKVSQLQAMLSMKEQSISELSQFLQSQSQKLSSMQSQLSASKVMSLQEEVCSLKQIIASKQQSMAQLSQFLQALSSIGGENGEKMLAMQEEQQMVRLQWQQEKEQLNKQIQLLRGQLEEAENDSLIQGEKLVSSPMIDQMHVKLSTKEDEVNRLHQIIQEKDLIIKEITQKAQRLQTKLEEAQPNQEKETLKATLQELSQSLEAKQKYIDQFSEYMNEKLVNVKQLTQKLKDHEQKEAQAKLNEDELKLQLQSKDKDISQFTQYINEQLKIVAELTEKLKLYQQKEGCIQSYDRTIATQERQQYETTIHELQSTVQNKQRQIDEFSQYMNDQLKTVGQLNEKIKNLEQQKQSQGQNNSLAEKLSSDERAAYQKTISQLQHKLHKREKEIKELNSYIKDQLNTVQQLTQKLEAFAEKEEKGEKEEEEEKEAKHREKQAQLQRQENQIIIFSDKIQQLKQILKSKEESLAEMSQFLEEYYLSKAKLEEDISNLQDQNSALKQQIQDLKQKDTTQASKTSQSKLTNQLSQEQQSAQEIKNIRQLKNIIDEKEEELTNLLRKIEERDSDYRDLEQIITTKTETIAELSSFMNQQSQRLAELQGLVEKYQSEKNQMAANDHQQTSERQSMAQDKLTELRQKNSTLQKVIEEKDATIVGLTQLIDQRQQNIKQLQDKVNKQIEQSSLVTLDAEKVAELQALIANQGQTILLLKEQTQALQSREEQLQNELDSIESQHRSLFQQNKQLKQQLQLLRQSNQAVHKQQRSRRSSYGVREALKEEMGTLKEKIVDLEETLQAKAETIKELSQYMNEQAMKLVELESKELSKSGQTQRSAGNNEKVNDLETIIKSKEASIIQLTEYLNENYTKIQSLEQQVKGLEEQLKKAAADQRQFKSEPTIAQIVKQEREESMLIELQRAVLQKKQILNQLQLAIDEKELQLSFIKNEIADEKTKLQLTRSEKVQVEKEIKYKSTQRQGPTDQPQRVSRDNTNQQSYLAKNKENFKQFFLEKEEEINSITEILEKLQDELRSKNEMIQYLQQTLKAQRAQRNSYQELPFQAAATENIKDQRIQELQAEVQTLRQQHKQLKQRLDKQQQHLILQEEHDIIGLEDEMKKQSQRYSDNLKQQIQQLKQSAKKQEKESVRALKDSAERQQSQLSQMRDERLTTTQLLSQLMLYSDEGANMRAIRVLIASLSQKYHRELVEYQNQSGQLKETVQSLIQLNQNLSLEVRNFRESLRQKEHIIEELHEINYEKQHSYQQKLQEIRQSLTMLGSEVPNFLSKILEGKQQSPQRQSLKRSLKQSASKECSPSRSSLKQPEPKSLKDEMTELKEQIQRLREQSQLKDKELQELRQLRTSKNRTYQRQLQDLLMDSNAKEDPSIQLEELQAEKERLTSLCIQLEGKLSVSQKQKKQQVDIIEVLNEKINTLERSLGGFALSAAAGGQNQNSGTRNEITSKVLADLEDNIPSRGKESQKSGWRQSNEVQDPSMESKMLEKDDIIIELQETILNIQKGFNHEIMELRRNIAELQAEVLSLRRHLYIADPNALDVSELVRETCTQQSKPTQFFKPAYKLRYKNNINNSFNYSPAQPLQNSSFYTQGKRNNYEPYYNTANLTLGEKMMGRRIREDYPLNLTINNQFKIQNSPWETTKIQQI